MADLFSKTHFFSAPFLIPETSGCVLSFLKAFFTVYISKNLQQDFFAKAESGFPGLFVPVFWSHLN